MSGWKMPRGQCGTCSQLARDLHSRPRSPDRDHTTEPHGTTSPSRSDASSSRCVWRSPRSHRSGARRCRRSVARGGLPSRSCPPSASDQFSVHTPTNASHASQTLDRDTPRGRRSIGGRRAVRPRAMTPSSCSATRSPWESPVRRCRTGRSHVDRRCRRGPWHATSVSLARRPTRIRPLRSGWSVSARTTTPTSSSSRPRDRGPGRAERCVRVVRRVAGRARTS